MPKCTDDRKVAFAICAHPDDIEIFMGGTFLLLKDAGYELHYMNVANGCMGSMEYSAERTIEIRQQESLDAATYAGAEHHPALCNDLEVFYTKDLIWRLTAVIRKVNPSIILTHPPADYMEDHTNTCRLAVTAAFSRGMPNLTSEPPVDPVMDNVTVYHSQPHTNRDPLGNLVTPDFFVDVAGKVDAKQEMLSKHVSQKAWLDASQGMDSYLQTMTDFSLEMGKLSGQFEYAEGWRKHHYAGYCDPDDDPLVDALSELVTRP
jgi:LmbE family N-acetylglucosaminyl deacetylase